MKNKLTLILTIAAVVLFLDAAFTIPYTVDERERVVIMQWGVPYYEITDAGLHAKWLWPYQSVHTLEKRWIPYHASAKEVFTVDKKALMVDTVAYFRISNGIRYIQSVQTLQNAQARVDDVAYSEMRKALGVRNLEDVVVKDRASLMTEVAKASSVSLQQCCGLDTRLVRVIRADLPKENKPSVYGRMKSERERMAKEYRSKGEEEAMRITSDTDREVTIIKSEAVKQAQKNRGEGDAEATRLYNEAYGRDPNFFRLYRGLEAARKAMTGSGEVRIIQDGTEPHLRAIFGK